MRRHARLSVLASIVAGIPAVAFAQTWGRPPVPSNGVCFYENINYAGQYFCSGTGTSNTLVPADINDRISSIRIYGNADVVVYRDSGFRGASQRIESSVRDLRGSGWNDRITSFQVGRRSFWGGSPSNEFDTGDWGGGSFPRNGACFYEHPSFSGRYFCSSAGTNVGQVPGGSNDRVSSIRTFGIVTVTVFQDASFEGRNQTFTSDVRDLKGVGWDDLISSLRVTSRGLDFSQGMRVFADINFKGRSATLGPNTPDVSSNGMGRLISSLRIPPGETWQVCTEPNYRGRCDTITSDASDLRRGDWNDLIASVRRLR